MVQDHTSSIKSAGYVEQLLYDNVSHFLTVRKKKTTGLDPNSKNELQTHTESEGKSI